MLSSQKISVYVGWAIGENYENIVRWGIFTNDLKIRMTIFVIHEKTVWNIWFYNEWIIRLMKENKGEEPRSKIIYYAKRGC